MTTHAPTRPPLGAFWRDLPREGKFFLSTVVVETFGSGLVLPFGVVYLHEVRGLALALTGILLGVPAVVGLVIVGPVGTLIDRYGARRLILVGTSSQLLGNVLLAFATTAWLAGAAYALLGVGLGIFFPALNSMIAALVPSAIRQRYFGLNFTLVNVGIGMGGIVAGLLVNVHRPGTFMAIYLANAATFLAPILLMLGPLRHVSGKAERPAEDDDDAPQPSYLSILRQRAVLPMLALTFLSAFVGYAQLEAGFTAYARVVGQVSTRTIGLAFAVNTAVIVVLQLLVLQRIEGRRRTRVIVLMSAIWALTWVLTGLAGADPGSLTASLLVVAALTVFALGETLLQPTVPAITNDLSPDHLRGRYNAVMSGAFQVAAVTGPVVAGVFIGAHWNLAFIGLLVLCCAGIALIALVIERVVTPAVNGVRPAGVPDAAHAQASPAGPPAAHYPTDLPRRPPDLVRSARALPGGGSRSESGADPQP